MTDTASTSPKPRHTTWLDPPWAWPHTDFSWMNDPDRFITRQELLERVREFGADDAVAVDETTLVFWEKRGVLPRPVHRWRDGAPRALYPDRAWAAVFNVRLLQQQGLPLDIIAEWVASHARDGPESVHRFLDANRSARVAALQLAHAEERILHLAPGTIRGVEVRFTDANGDRVATWIDGPWSDDLLAKARAIPTHTSSDDTG
jgi:hypothetical protein